MACEFRRTSQSGECFIDLGGIWEFFERDQKEQQPVQNFERSRVFSPPSRRFRQRLIGDWSSFMFLPRRPIPWSFLSKTAPRVSLPAFDPSQGDFGHPRRSRWAQTLRHPRRRLRQKLLAMAARRFLRPMPHPAHHPRSTVRPISRPPSTPSSRSWPTTRSPTSSSSSNAPDAIT